MDLPWLYSIRWAMMAEIILITGDLEVGKTSFCRELADLTRKKGLSLFGLISPAVFRDGEKVAIDVEDLRSGELKRLAELNDGPDDRLQTKRWTFNPEVVDWGNQILSKVIPCDLLLIDELGPLEFERNQGWTNGIQAVSRGDYRAAVVVVRPSLLEMARELWPMSLVIDLDERHQDPQGLFDSLALD